MSSSMHRLRLADPPVPRPGRRTALSLPCEPASVPAARRHVRQALRSWGRDDLEEAGSLIVSEMVTNALLHARTEVSVELLDGDDAVVLVVADRSPALPAARRHPRESATGRGLWLLDHFSQDRGVQVHEGGKRVWAVLCPEVHGPDEGSGARLATLLDEGDTAG